MTCLELVIGLLTWKKKESLYMTSKAGDITVEYHVPVPVGRQNDRERLPQLPLAEMKEGGSFLLKTRDDEHTTRKLSAVRSAVSRFCQANPGFAFRVFRWRAENTDEQGVRVFRIRGKDATYESI